MQVQSSIPSSLVIKAITPHIAQCIEQFIKEPLVFDAIEFVDDGKKIEKELAYLFNIPCGEPIASDRLAQGVRNIFKKGAFTEIVLTLSEEPHKKLTVHVVQDWIVALCSVQGIRENKQKYLHTYAFFEGNVFDKERHKQSVGLLQQALREDGYLQAKVADALEYNECNKRISILLTVEQGPRYRYGTVKTCIKGMEFLRGGPKFSTEFVGILTQGLTDQYCSQELVTRLVKQIEKLSIGYGLSKIEIAEKKTIHNDTHVVDLEFFIDATDTKQIIFEGNEFFSSDALRLHCVPHPQLLHLMPVPMLAQDIIDTYKEHGFSQVRVEAEEQAHTIVFTIKEGEQAAHAWEQENQEKNVVETKNQQPEKDLYASWVFGPTIIKGIPPVDFNVIKREIAYKENDVWNQELIKKTTENLRRLNVFDHISVSPYAPLLNEHSKAVMISVTPASWGEVATRFGFGLQQAASWVPARQALTYALGASVLLRNVTKNADLFTLNVDIARAYNTVNMTYHTPWLGNLPIHTTLKAYYAFQDYPAYVLNGRSIFSMNKAGFACRLQRELCSFNGTCNAGVESIYILPYCSNTLCGITTSLLKSLCLSGTWINNWVPYFFLEPACTYTWGDATVSEIPVPVTTLGIRALVPYNTTRNSGLVKCAFEQSFFFPIGYAVGALKVACGHIFSKDFTQIPPFERFFLGGAYSVRGFQPDACAPRAQIADTQGNTSWVPIGGQSMAQVNLELRVPFTEFFEGVVFQDVGVLRQSCNKNVMQHVSAATGGGIRYNTPLGPLRFDIGFNWPRDPLYPTYAWFLSLGHTF